MGEIANERNQNREILSSITEAIRCLTDKTHKDLKQQNIGLGCVIFLKFDKHLGGSAVETPVKFQNDTTIL